MVKSCVENQNLYVIKSPLKTWKYMSVQSKGKYNLSLWMSVLCWCHVFTGTDHMRVVVTHTLLSPIIILWLENRAELGFERCKSWGDSIAECIKSGVKNFRQNVKQTQTPPQNLKPNKAQLHEWPLVQKLKPLPTNGTQTPVPLHES